MAPTLAQIKARLEQAKTGKIVANEKSCWCPVNDQETTIYQLAFDGIAFLLAEVERLDSSSKSYMEDWQLEYKLHHETKQKLAQAEALLAALPDGAIETLKKWYAEKQRAAQAEARCVALEGWLYCQYYDNGMDDEQRERFFDWVKAHPYVTPQEGAR